MPVAGNRIPVKLPWKGATNDEPQFVSMKKPVAEFFGFDEATREELSYKVKVQKKDKSDGEKVTGTTEVTRRRRPGYKQRAVRVVFQMGRPAAGSRKSTLTGKQVKVGKDSYKSIQFPITTSVPIEEVINFFEKGGGSKLKALKLVEANTGQGYPLITK